MFYLRLFFYSTFFLFSSFSSADKTFKPQISEPLEFESDALPFSAFEESFINYPPKHSMNTPKIFLNRFEDSYKFKNDILQFHVLKIKKPSPYPYRGVVKLISLDNGNQGTGFFIRPDVLATANHVAKVAKTGLFLIEDPYTGDLTIKSIEVLDRDEKHDLALLRVMDYESEHTYSVGSLEAETESDTHKIADYIQFGVFRSDQVREKDFVTAAGFPHNSFNLIQGVVRSPFSFMTKVDVTNKTDESMTDFGGLSGSPVFSEDGQLLGVISKGNRPGDWEFLLFVPVEILRDLVRKLEGKNLMPSTKPVVIKNDKKASEHFIRLLPQLQESKCRQALSSI